MNDTLRTVAVGVLAVLAVALAAATLDSTIVPEGSGPGGPSWGDGGGVGDGDGGLLPPPESGATPSETFQIPFLPEILTVLAVLAVIALVASVILYWRQTLSLAALVVLVLGGLVALTLLLSPSTGAPGVPLIGADNGNPLGGGGGGGIETTQPSSPSLVVLLVLGIALLGALVGLSRPGSHEENPADDESTDRTAGDAPTAVGRAAGRAADRLESSTGPDPENEVYRAWQEMTDLLDVADPETTTPGEFAAAAVDGGLDRSDVSELTHLFEEVRYGNTLPTEEHERQAVQTFRRIEQQYTQTATEEKGDDNEKNEERP